jgi:16S rRNA (guanine966-N2)-methyltransferase
MFRGSRLIYRPQPGTRPMKHRLREATFDLLGPAIKAKHAVDLFAGSGALALEALSRGATSATMIERHIPTAETIRQNLIALGIDDRADVLSTSAFVWVTRGTDLPPFPWAVFCSPPYAFYTDKRPEMVQLIERLVTQAPASSLFVVESDDRLDFADLAPLGHWDVRRYPPAQLGILTT